MKAVSLFRVTYLASQMSEGQLFIWNLDSLLHTYICTVRVDHCYTVVFGVDHIAEVQWFRMFDCVDLHQMI